MAQTKINKKAARIFTGLHRRLYTATGGRIGGSITGGNMIVLTTTGRRSQKQRARPLVAAEHPDGWTVVASFSGHDEHPAWYLNLMANPAATVQVGTAVHEVAAREVNGEERAELWDQMAGIYPDYNEYQAVTEREIPVLVLERQSR